MAVAAYLEVCGARLRELSLNHVNKVPSLVLRNNNNISMLDYRISFALLHYLSVYYALSIFRLVHLGKLDQRGQDGLS